MKFKGFQKVSIIDYPSKICGIAFVGGCNFRCHYCHNPELVIGYENLPDISEDYIINFMQKRKGLLDGLSITGGEPTLIPDLPQFMEKIKEIGFLVKLDTNGTNPDMLSFIIEKKIVDYIAMDIKGTPSCYQEIVNVPVDISKIKASVKIIMESNINYEFRTTVVPKFFNEEDIKEINKWIKEPKRYVLQQPKTIKTLDGKFQNIPLYTKEELKKFASFLPNCIVRY